LIFRINYKELRDDENFQFVAPEQKKKFINKKANKKRPEGGNTVVGEKTLDAKPKRKVVKTARKKESDDEIKPFPDFLKKVRLHFGFNSFIFVIHKLELEVFTLQNFNLFFL
jgi:hypothetical protein